MSDLYEGVVFRSDERTALHVFDAITSKLKLRLVRLTSDVFGIYRVADRGDPFDQPAVEAVAERMSIEAGPAAALFYDNRCGVRFAVLYSSGHRGPEFGDDDAWWVPYGEDGDLVIDGPRYREFELHPDEEYDCIFSAIDAALESVAPDAGITAHRVYQAFCYEEAEVLAEFGGAA